MSEILNDVDTRFTLQNSAGDQLHVFRVPDGTVIHVTVDQGEDFQHTSAILLEDDIAPAVIKALQRCAKVPVSVVEVVP